MQFTQQNLAEYRNVTKEDDSLKFDDLKAGVNNKGFRSLLRDDIEEIIKEKCIDRNNFHEFSKINYVEILKKFYFSFSDIKNFPVNFEPLEIHRMHFRSDLTKECIDCYFRTYDWCEYMNTIKSAIPDDEKKLFLILSDRWVYEGESNEMFSVLNEMERIITDFYIVSSKFNWFIAVSYITDNAVMYNR